MPLKTAYPNIPQDNLQKLYGRVLPQDLAYLKALFPFVNGLYEIVISHLFKQFIHDLRNTGLDPANPSDVALHSSHPSISVLERLLAELPRRTAGEPAGHSNPPRNRPRKDRGVRAKNGDLAAKRSNPQGGDA